MFGKKDNKKSKQKKDELVSDNVTTEDLTEGVEEEKPKKSRVPDIKLNLEIIPDGVDFTVGSLWNTALALALIMTVTFGYIIYNNIKEKATLSFLTSESEEIYDYVSNQLTQIDEVARNVIKHNPDSEQIIEMLQKAVPENLRIVRVVEPVASIEPDTVFPGINFATLDMIKTTSKTQEEQLPEIHLYGQKNQYLNYVYIQKANESYIVISYPVSAIIDKTKHLNADNGTLSLLQKSGDWSNITLQHWGEKDDGISYTKKEVNVPGSHFYITYGVKQPQLGFMQLGLISAIIAFSAGILLTVMVYQKRKIIFDKGKAKIAKEKGKQHYVPKSVQAAASKSLPQDTKNILMEKELEKKAALPDQSIFKAYDIRGIVDKTLTESTVEQIGQAIGTENINRGCHKIVVARDGRLSGPLLLDALIKGLKKSGCDVINIGAVPTGVLYFATHHLETGSGVMLTGSHNPADYNGLKIMLNGETLAGKLIQDLYKAIVAGELKEGEGTYQEMDIVDDYIDQISSDIQLENQPTIVVDCGNGIPGGIAPELLEEIGCEVIPLHCEVDGNFPNHHPDPSVPENLEDLIATMKQTDADLGIAFDGDGDRLGVVTKSGEIIYPDRLMMLFAKDVLTRQPGSSIIFDVKCTGHLPKYIVKSGGMPIMWKTGHSFMKAKLKETDAAMAGEMSGHFFFNERWFGFDDGIYAAARLLEILDQESEEPQAVFDTLPKGVSTPELKVHMKEGEHYEFIEQFVENTSFPDAKVTTIDGIRADYNDGWGLVRCSNTTPCLVIRFDADNQAALERIQQDFKTKLWAVNDGLELPF